MNNQSKGKPQSGKQSNVQTPGAIPRDSDLDSDAGRTSGGKHAEQGTGSDAARKNANANDVERRIESDLDESDEDIE